MEYFGSEGSNALRVLGSAGLLLPDLKATQAPRASQGSVPGPFPGLWQVLYQPAPLAALLLLPGLFGKFLERFQSRPEMNTGSDQAQPVTGHCTECWNEDQFVLITLENI